jgi:hypothetical protein
MTGKAAFDADEWAVVVGAPVAAATAVITASPGGTLRESMSMARGYAEARRSRPVGLLQEVLASAPALNQMQVRKPDDARQAALDTVRRAVDIVRRKADPEELEDYRSFVRWLAETVAHAHKEGGFLGIGGRPVSDAEQATIDDISAALGRDGDPPGG